MKPIFRYITMVVFCAFAKAGTSQNAISDLQQTLSFTEYIGYVKQHHPILKQANLQLEIGTANLLKARGGFDPKIEVDYDRKKFKNTEYFDQLNATFKIPTWYGVEFKANFEENTGAFLNPSLTVPEGGLYSAGVSFSLAQGFLINERMAMLKKAKFFLDQSSAERDLVINEVIFEASKAYFEWLEAAQEFTIYDQFLNNADIRWKAVKRNVEVGEMAAIDSVEAKIALQSRMLKLEAARLKQKKAVLQLSNYLWIDEVPVELQDQVTPLVPNIAMVVSSLDLKGNRWNDDIWMQHPKLRGLDAKISGLKIDQSLKRNMLLPKLDVQYNFLSSEGTLFEMYNTSNYKAFVNFSVPIFLRKERGDLQLANLKVQDANFEKVAVSLVIQNKMEAAKAEIASLDIQQDLIKEIVSNYGRMLTAEERKFELGESSLFLINVREQKLIEASLKENELKIKTLHANVQLFNAMGISEVF